MSRENSAGLGVDNRYGPRTIPEGKVGGYKSTNAEVQFAINVDGEDITSAGFDTIVIPAGFKPVRAIVEVEDPGALVTNSTIVVGTAGSEATNGVSISEAQAEAAGTYLIDSFNGTWANRLAANTAVGIAMSGTTTAAIVGGAYKIIILGYRE